MKNMKKIMALGLASVMTLSMAACGNDGNGDSQSGAGNNQGNSGNQGNQGNSGNQGGVVDTDKAFGTGDGSIEIGSWWVQYYDSKNYAGGDMFVNPDWETAQPSDSDDADTAAQKEINRNVAQMKWDNVKTIEEKYGVTFSWENLTYAGVQDSINTSIIAGSPDCEVYLVEAQMAIPAQMNGLAVDLKTILPADDDLFTDQSNMGYLDLGDGKACILYQKSGQSNIEATYPLGFNMQLLEENNLEDPRVLWERGEWTWEKFIEYCQVLTQDTDGDGQVDQYGYCGYEQETFEQLMMSNGANIASGTTENLSSAATGEALQMMYDMYNTYKSSDGFSICYPYDYEGNPSDSMRIQYCQGNIGFFPIAVWIANGQNNYSPNTDQNDYSAKHLTFDTAYVRWPVGTSGNKDTNPGKNAASGTSYYIIAAGSQNPGTAYNVLADFFNWYHDDVAIRDDKATLNWWFNENAFEPELQQENYDVMFDCGSHSTVDFWNSLGADTYSTDAGNGIQLLMKGEMTPAQFQESFKQRVQDALDSTYGN